MPQRATIRVREDARDRARITKAKLGFTWAEFLERAARELDPENSD